jgi:hypothetical protein
MHRSIRSLGGVVAAVLLLAVSPGVSLAQASGSLACPASKTHALPKVSSRTTPVFTIGVKGGSLRPWTIKINLDGTITATGTSANSQLSDSKNALGALMKLADANGFFSLKKSVGCLSGAGNPDVSTRFISIHTSTGTKHVNGFGTCDAQFDGVWDILSASAGTGA